MLSFVEKTSQAAAHAKETIVATEKAVEEKLTAAKETVEEKLTAAKEAVKGWIADCRVVESLS